MLIQELLKINEDVFPAGTKVKINKPGDAHHGEEAIVKKTHGSDEMHQVSYHVGGEHYVGTGQYNTKHLKVLKEDSSISEGYHSSAMFDEAINDIKLNIEHSLNYMKSVSMKQYIADTKRNLATDAHREADAVIDALETVKNDLDVFYEKMIKAGE